MKENNSYNTNKNVIPDHSEVVNSPYREKNSEFAEKNQKKGANNIKEDIREDIQHENANNNK